MARLWRILIAVCGLLFLAAVFFPAFRPVPENWHNPRAGCMSNMKQLGLALIQYSQDYNETLPRDTNAAGHGWREAIYPYVQSPGVYRCPDDQRDTSHASLDNLPESYAANALCLATKNRQTAPMSLSSDTILAADTRGYDGEDWNIVSPAFLPQTDRELYTHKPSHYFYEHPPGTLNVLFADGHVKAMEPEATLMPRNLWTPNNTPFVGQDLSNARAILTHAGK
jgi:prepilin-type processing-associated H-X9-DG protein